MIPNIFFQLDLLNFSMTRNHLKPRPIGLAYWLPTAPWKVLHPEITTSWIGKHVMKDIQRDHCIIFPVLQMANTLGHQHET